MRQTVTLGQEEIKIAIAQYLRNSGFEPRGPITLSATASRSWNDQLTGGYDVTASVEAVSK
jgi:hypothetical protein